LDEVIDKTVGARSYGCWDLYRQRHGSGDGDFRWEQDGIRSLWLVWALEFAMIPFVAKGDLVGEIRDHFGEGTPSRGVG
jgi:hypothetical protein